MTTQIDKPPLLRLIGCSDGELVLARPAGSVVRVQLTEVGAARVIADLATWLQVLASERAVGKVE